MQRRISGVHRGRYSRLLISYAMGRILQEMGVDDLSVKIMRQFAMKYLIVGGHWTIYAEATPKTVANGRQPVNAPRIAVWHTWKQLLKGILYFY